MTALRPKEGVEVRGVPSTRYLLNPICAHPDCSRDDVTGHHIFGRPPGTHSDSWFVSMKVPEDELALYKKLAVRIDKSRATIIIPAVAGLCGHGTEGHHGEAEEHQGWIKLEDGAFVWYQRKPEYRKVTRATPEHVHEIFDRVGPLTPQPGAAATKRRKPNRKKGDPASPTWTVKAPKDDPEAADRLKEKTHTLQDKFNEAGHKIGPTVALERAVDYTLLNAGDEDF